MAPLPPSIRVNSNVPFPALVQGSGAVVIGRFQGVWSIGLNFAILPQQLPPIASQPTDYLIVYDAIAGIFFRLPLTSIGPTGGGARTQRSVTASPIVIAVTDQILNCNINVAATCQLPAAASRNGVPLTWKDVGAQAAAHNILITPFGAETIDGAASLTINFNRQEVTLVPFNDGVNTGWFIS